MSPSTPQEYNPYKPPSADIVPEEETRPFVSLEGETAETLRTTYLAHEAVVKAIGLYLYVTAGGALLYAFALGSSLVDEIAGRMPDTPQAQASIRIILIASNLFGALLNAMLGYFLRRLRNWSRWIVLVTAGLRILGMIQATKMAGARADLGTAVSVVSILVDCYVIYTLLPGGDQVVFSPRYRDAVAETPQIHPGWHARDRLFLGIAVINDLVGFINRIS